MLVFVYNVAYIAVHEKIIGPGKRRGGGGGGARECGELPFKMMGCSSHLLGIKSGFGIS